MMPARTEQFRWLHFSGNERFWPLFLAREQEKKAAVSVETTVASIAGRIIKPNWLGQVGSLHSYDPYECEER